MDSETLKAAPRELRTRRLRLQAPRPEHAPALLDSINTSLHTLGFISFGRSAWDHARAERHLTDGLAMIERGECDAQGRLGEHVMFAMLPTDWAAAVAAPTPRSPR